MVTNWERGNRSTHRPSSLLRRLVSGLISRMTRWLLRRFVSSATNSDSHGDSLRHGSTSRRARSRLGKTLTEAPTIVIAPEHHGGSFSFSSSTRTSGHANSNRLL